MAIACCTLEQGTEVRFKGATLTLGHTILEGHRFAVRVVRKGEPLLSWGLPFGLALTEIRPGDYVCNEWILIALRQRHVKFELPPAPNFENHRIRYQLDPQKLNAGKQVERYARPGTFEGFDRGARGVGTRNFVVVLGTSSRTASYARALAERFRSVPSKYGNIDGVAAIAHTEGGGTERPNNLDFVLRALAGFVVHPNVGAVLAVDVGNEAVTNHLLHAFMSANNYPLNGVTHAFLSMTGSFDEALARGESIVRGWLPEVDQCRRTTQPLEKLRIALQCGGSDAFSGVSANPLLGLVAKELVRNGGSANLAETDELIGAEPYVLSNVRDLETARAFLNRIERFQERASWHGETAEGNPSGGNNFRGLYNITVKSIGAARKKDPELRLDYVIDYAQPMTAPGFYFMDSPGNDLEGIAGQVAAGCTMILFTTGNGSITNFPFVPTMKIMTNSGRYNMLAREMDVNAGRYLDGTPMETLGRETFELLVRLASGERSAGERVGYPQVQLWRDWPQTGPGRVEEVLGRETPTGKPLRTKLLRDGPRVPAVIREEVGLLLPTSLCASQVARGIAQQLNGVAAGLDRFVALPHTEGCGVGGGISEQIYLRTMAGYLVHPLVARALVLEHGCEKTHNDAMRNYAAEHAIDAEQFGWASIQLDGGLEKVTEKVRAFFAAPAEGGRQAGSLRYGRLETCATVALVSSENAPPVVADVFARVASSVVASGGSVVVPESFPAAAEVFGAILDETIKPTIGYGEPAVTAGFHVMETPTRHFVETLTGLGATGVDVIIAYVGEQSRQGHPLVPTLQVGSSEKVPDVDLSADAKDLVGKIIALLPRVTTGEYRPRAFRTQNTDFQMTRGLLGVSL